MFKFLVLMSSLVSSVAFADPEKCQKSVAAQVREKYGTIDIISIEYGGSYQAGTMLNSDNFEFSFNQSGYIYWVDLEAFGSQGLDVFLVNENCGHLDDINVFGEE